MQLYTKKKKNQQHSPPGVCGCDAHSLSNPTAAPSTSFTDIECSTALFFFPPFNCLIHRGRNDLGTDFGSPRDDRNRDLLAASLASGGALLRARMISWIFVEAAGPDHVHSFGEPFGWVKSSGRSRRTSLVARERQGLDGGESPPSFQRSFGCKEK